MRKIKIEMVGGPLDGLRMEGFPWGSHAGIVMSDPNGKTPKYVYEKRPRKGRDGFYRCDFIGYWEKMNAPKS